MVNFTVRDEERALFRRLGLASSHTEVLTAIGTVRYPAGEVLVEAGAIEIPNEGTANTPAGQFRVRSDWNSLWRFTVNDHQAEHPTVVVAATAFGTCWPLVEMLMSGLPLDSVTLVARQHLDNGTIEISQDPAAAFVLTSAAALGRPTVYVPAEFPEGVFTLRVSGDSMAGDGIGSGDLVVVDPAQAPADGDIAAVTLSWRDEVTGRAGTARVIKRLREGGTVFESSNPEVPPFSLPPFGRAAIMGKVLAALAVDGNVTTVTPFTGGPPYRFTVPSPPGAE